MYGFIIGLAIKYFGRLTLNYFADEWRQYVFKIENPV